VQVATKALMPMYIAREAPMKVPIPQPALAPTLATA